MTRDAYLERYGPIALPDPHEENERRSREFQERGWAEHNPRPTREENRRRRLTSRVMAHSARVSSLSPVRLFRRHVRAHVVVNAIGLPEPISFVSSEPFGRVVDRPLGRVPPEVTLAELFDGDPGFVVFVDAFATSVRPRHQQPYSFLTSERRPHRLDDRGDVADHHTVVT